jgi:para-nitrobenzyl esterase
VISTPQGPLRGVVRNGVIEVRGIPYARKPERWSPPQPAGNWKELRDAGRFGPACPQLARFGLTEASDEEDCLSLNVSRPRSIPAGRRLPVLVWIHGGAVVGGSSNLYRLDALARRNLVVVSPNYRLGVLGFKPDPAFDQASNGNLGLMDQREALRWVQRNIAAFGGDPTNVTIAGESAGAGSICAHLAAPELSGGLFHKAVLISAGCLAPLPTVQTYSTLGSDIAAAVGFRQANREALLACLRAQPLSQLLERGDGATKGRTMSLGPSTGAAQANPRSMAEALAEGKVLKVPLLMGGARDELRLYMGYDQQSSDPITSKNYATRLFSHYVTEEEKDLPLNQSPLKERHERIPDALSAHRSESRPRNRRLRVLPRQPEGGDQQLPLPAHCHPDARAHRHADLWL